MLKKTRRLWIPFIGSDAFPTASPGHYGLIIKDTSAAGTPTYVFSTSNGGGLTITMAATNEAEILTLYTGDELHFDIDELIRVEWTVAMSQATLNAASMLGVGVCSAQNDTWDSIAQMAALRLVGASNALVAETDDGVNDNDDVATGQTLGTTFKTLEVSFAAGKRDVQFLVDGAPINTSTTFSMANYSGSLQPFLQFQKTSGTQTDAMIVKELVVEYRL